MGFSPTDAADFYTAAAPKLQWFFSLLTFAMEVGAGLAIFEVRNADSGTHADIAKITKRINDIESELAELARCRAILQNEPEVFEAEFRRNAHAGLLQVAQQHSLGQIGRFVALVVMGIMVIHTSAAQPIHVIEGLDYSKSELDKHNRLGNPHESDIEAAVRVIYRLPPGARVDVLGITDESFARPLNLLTGQIPTEHGPLEFIDQIQLARNRLATQFRTAAQSVKPDFQQSDILGFLVLSGKMLQTRDGRHVLLLFSDMRNFTRQLDIESPFVVPVASALQTVKRKNLIANLRDTDVYIFGVHAIGKDVEYASTLEQYWRAYFTAAGANLRIFSMTRDISDLNRIR